MTSCRTGSGDSRGGGGGGGEGNGGMMTAGSLGVDRSRALLLAPRFLFLLLDTCFVDDNEEEDDACADGVSYMKCRAVTLRGNVAGVVCRHSWGGAVFRTFLPQRKKLCRVGTWML